ncbi:MAG: hypothetical protein LBL13_12455 [Bacteroidales bacterium]|nr:hypothetical protein [Bacteroidales bacterium]
MPISQFNLCKSSKQQARKGEGTKGRKGERAKGRWQQATSNKQHADDADTKDFRR